MARVATAIARTTAAASAPTRPRPAGRVRLAREQRVGDILAAALQVFTEHGYDAASMADIAARCGIVEGTVYKYFDSKRGLLLKVLEGWYDELFGDYSRELPGLPDARTKLRYLIWRHLRTFRDNPLLARLMIMEVRSRPDYRGSPLYAKNQRYSSMMTGVIVQGVKAGQIRADAPVRTIRDLVYGGIEHLTWSYVAGHGRLDIDRQADELTGLLWHGLAAAPGAAGSKEGSAVFNAQLVRLARIADRLEKL
jgi:AcrR family transcriptional regulator